MLVAVNTGWVISGPSSRGRLLVSRSSKKVFGWLALWITISGISIWRKKLCSLSTALLVQKCYLCSRYVQLPMCPRRTVPTPDTAKMGRDSMSAISGSMESGQASSSSLPIRISSLGPWRPCPRFDRCSDQKPNTRHRMRNLAPGCAASQIPDRLRLQSRVVLDNPFSEHHTEVSPSFSPHSSADSHGGLLGSVMNGL